MFSRRGPVASIALVLAACGGGGDDTAQVPHDMNSAPVAAVDSARTRPGDPVDIDVLANDLDDDGDDLVVELPAANASATFEVISGNRLRVTPADDFGGILTFSYRVRDSAGAYSAPANVVVEVGPLARAMLAVAPTGAGRPRVIVSGAMSAQSRDLLSLESCNQPGFATIAGDGRRILGRRCVSESRVDVIMDQPRAATLVSPTVIYGNAALAPGLVVEGNFSGFLVAERVSNPDDLSLGSTYDLVRVDVERRAVVQRMPLPGIDTVTRVRRAGAMGRVLLSAREINGDSGEFLADIDLGTFRRITAADDLGIEYSTPSPSGRFLVANWPTPADVRGYDSEGPAQSQVLWTAPGVPGPQTYITNTQFLPGLGDELLVEVMDLLTREVTVWLVPLATPANAREVLTFTASLEHSRVLLRDGIGLIAEDAGSGRSHIKGVRIDSGQVLEQLTPAGGVLLESLDFYTGTSVLFTMTEGDQRHAARIRVDAPGVVQTIAPAIEPELYSLTIDQDETTIGFRSTDGTGVSSAWLVDVNLPQTAFPLAPTLQPQESAFLLLALGVPDP